MGHYKQCWHTFGGGLGLEFFIPQVTEVFLKSWRLLILEDELVWEFWIRKQCWRKLLLTEANTGHSTSGFLWDYLAQVNASSYIFGSVLRQQYLFPIKIICYCCWNTTALQKTAIRKEAGCNLSSGGFILSALGFSPCHKLWSLFTFSFDSASFIPGSANSLYCSRSCIYQKVEKSLTTWFILPKEQKCILGGQLFLSHYTAATYAKLYSWNAVSYIGLAIPLLLYQNNSDVLSQCQTG